MIKVCNYGAVFVLEDQRNANMTVFCDTVFVVWWKHTLEEQAAFHLQGGVQLTLAKL
jgi:hypothetical protein